MIKRTFVLITCSLLFLSCSLSKEVREARKTVDGTWTLQNVGYAGNEGDFKAILFNDAEAVCFEGSTWFFRNNNSTGNYTIPQGSLCSGGMRNIRWSIIENEGSGRQLQFKYIDEKKNDINGRTGYRMDIVSLGMNQMTLKSDVQVDGAPVSVTYEFQKQ